MRKSTMVEILRFAQDDNPPVILSATKDLKQDDNPSVILSEAKDLKITFTAKKAICARGEGLASSDQTHGTPRLAGVLS